MKKYHFKIVLFTLALLITTIVTGQNIRVSGTVIDPNGNAIVGVSVLEIDGKNCVITTNDGRYEISVTKIPTTLEFSLLGMKTKTVVVNSQGVIDVTMEDDVVTLDEFVMIGYGTMRKEEITTSIARVKSEDFIKGGVNSPLQLLQGRVAGLGIATTSGDPGGSLSIQLRGLSTLAASSSPLIVIDGIAGGSLNSISPEDIESIDVLKDGSAAAIYGTRGTNGVILINTKRPNSGFSEIEYHSYATADLRISEEDYPTADELRAYKQDPAFSLINDSGESTDWIKEVTRNPISQTHYLSARGGNKATNYVASVTYADKEGIFKTSYNESLTAKVSIDHSMYDDRIRLLFNVNDKIVRHGSADGELYSKALLRNPTLPIYNEDGSYYENSNGANPVELLNEYKGINNYNQLTMNGKIIIEPIDGLKLSAMGAYQNDYNQYEWSSTHKAYNSTMGSTRGTATISGGHGDDRTLELQADYQKSIGDHSISTILGYSYNKYTYQSWSMYAFDFPIDGFGVWNINTAESTLDGLSTLKSNKHETKLVGFYGRVNYNYDNKYLLMASLRREGSDKFGSNNRWGWFPAVSVGWRIINEDFMKSVKWINDLKLRVGYGVTGTAPSSSYQYIALYNFNPSYMSYVDGEWVNGIVPSNNPNPNLKWEEKHEGNIGLDFAFLDSRISGSIDAYYRYTKDLLYTYTVPTPPNIANSMLANVGSIMNKGIEISLNAEIIRSTNFNWSMGGNISFNENKLLKLSNDLYTLEYLKLGNLDHVQTYSHRLEEGWAIGNFYGWKTVGLKNNGTAWRIVDAENTTAGEDQKRVLGNGMPKMFAALQTNLRYKRFDFSMSFHGAFLYQILNQYRMKYETLAWLTSANIPKAAFEKVGDYYNYAPSTYCDRYIEDGDYLKMDNITIGYSFKVDAISFIKDARIYFAGKNLLTFTKYSGLDPEAVSITGLTPGVDSYIKYPTLKSFSLGINIIF